MCGFSLHRWVKHPTEGCYSIILNNDNGLSEDHGDVIKYAGSGGTRRGRLCTRTQPRQLGIPRSAVHGGGGWRPAGSVVRCSVARCDRPAMQVSRSRRAMHPPRHPPRHHRRLRRRRRNSRRRNRRILSSFIWHLRLTSVLPMRSSGTRKRLVFLSSYVAVRPGGSSKMLLIMTFRHPRTY